MRKIIKINEEKCDGCGLCANACHEGAIAIIGGKAKLISDSYCDGLGDCIGECPQGAISFEMREAASYDEKAVAELKKKKKQKTLILKAAEIPEAVADSVTDSELINWPLQIKLAPEKAPYFEGTEILVAADCAGFAAPDLHKTHIQGKVCLIGCPKLDEKAPYVEKLKNIIILNDVKEITVLYMEVPCCSALVMLLKKAIELSGREVTLTATKISMKGKIIKTEQNSK